MIMDVLRQGGLGALISRDCNPEIRVYKAQFHTRLVLIHRLGPEAASRTNRAGRSRLDLVLFRRTPYDGSAPGSLAAARRRLFTLLLP
jgi:hypothetical protein